ncbi:hypothetical protein E8E12_001431 [Didymella heteroderae]|uniref:2EXR domain-containing protein n=1 Tax=Didymella heteroderae TaxID=1769908 RepID=A0A9P4WK76_9PLEO|nr:hypothetical protein E8E12_001431 [Didymella heteroderae]
MDNSGNFDSKPVAEPPSNPTLFIPAPNMLNMFDFELFMQLPAELRETIYSYVLTSDRPIRPHLCHDSFWRNEAKFHDGNTAVHNAIFLLMNLTRASKKLREESLPVFYSANSFDIGSDTATYFTWLEGAGRLEWALHVNLVIPYHSEKYTASIMWMVSGYDKLVEEHDKEHRVNDNNKADSSSIPHLLRQHPRYLTGGFPELTTCILFRMLSTSLMTSTGSEFKRKIVLPVSNVSAFETDSRLRWLSMMTRGLGIDLHLVEQLGSEILHNGYVYVQWNRKYQKKDVGTLAGSNEKSNEDVMRRAKQQFPGIEEMARPEKSVFSRRPCFPSQGTLTWYDMPTMGGGRR